MNPSCDANFVVNALSHFQILCEDGSTENANLLKAMSCCTDPTVASFLKAFGGRCNSTLVGYIARLINFLGPTAADCSDIAVILLGRLQKVLFQRTTSPSSPSSPPLPIPSSLMFRSILTSFVVAVKLHSDRPPSMKTFAQIGGVRLAQLLRMELTFLMALEYQVHVTPEEYEEFRTRLHRSSCASLQSCRFLQRSNEAAECHVLEESQGVSECSSEVSSPTECRISTLINL